MNEFKATTIIALRKNGKTAIAGDGQVTLGSTVVKTTANKIRKLYDGTVISGFAGAAADAFSLFDKFENKLEEHQGKLKKASVELAKEWRTDKILRKLEAMLLVADKDNILIISGNGDILEPDNAVAAIGSGGNYAYSAAKALIENTDLEAKEIAEKSLEIASEVCIYTNSSIKIEEL